MSFFIQVLGHSFMQRALMVGIMVSLCAALLGVTMVLKGFSMLGDGLSRVGFGALSIALALSLSPLQVSIPLTLLAAFALLKLSSHDLLGGDTGIAIFSSGAMAIGVTVTALTRGMNTDVCNYMFGSILAMSRTDVYLSIAVSAVVLVLYIIFAHQLFSTTFDEPFAKATGVPVRGMSVLLALLISLTVVVGMRMMGALLISSLIIFPALTAMTLWESYRAVLISASISSMVCFVIGLMISFKYSIPTGAAIVLVNLFLWAVITIYKKLSLYKEMTS